MPGQLTLEGRRTAAMKRTAAAILGVPVDAFTREETIAYIFHLVQCHRTDRTPRLVCTLNKDSLADTLAWRPGQTRHPELLSILRGADLVTTDDTRLVWASRHLGPALKEPVTGADLVNGLAGEAARSGLSLYLLGGAGGALLKGASLLRERFPGLHIAGCDSPAVHVEGAPLADSPEADGEILEKIKSASPDLILASFGSPGQELFFGRNRHRLMVPVTVCLGGTFDFAAETVTNAPGRMRPGFLPWLLRFARHPGRLVNRRLLDLVKCAAQIWPSILVYEYAKRVAPHPYLKRCKSGVSYKYMTRGRTQVLHLTLPGSVDAGAVPRLASLIPKRPTAHLLLDVNDVAFIDSAGLGLLLSVMNLWAAGRYELLVTGAGPYAKKVMASNRLHDLFSGRLFDSLEDALAWLDRHAGESASCIEVAQGADSSTIAFSGSLKPIGISPAEIRGIASRVKGARCVLDLSALHSISTQGIILLLKLRDAVEKGGKTCTSQGAHGEVAQMLRVTRTESLV